MKSFVRHSAKMISNEGLSIINFSGSDFAVVIEDVLSFLDQIETTAEKIFLHLNDTENLLHQKDQKIEELSTKIEIMTETNESIKTQFDGIQKSYQTRYILTFY